MRTATAFSCCAEGRHTPASAPGWVIIISCLSLQKPDLRLDPSSPALGDLFLRDRMPYRPGMPYFVKQVLWIVRV